MKASFEVTLPHAGCTVAPPPQRSVKRHAALIAATLVVISRSAIHRHRFAHGFGPFRRSRFLAEPDNFWNLTAAQHKYWRATGRRGCCAGSSAMRTSPPPAMSSSRARWRPTGWRTLPRLIGASSATGAAPVGASSPPAPGGRPPPPPPDGAVPTSRSRAWRARCRDCPLGQRLPAARLGAGGNLGPTEGFAIHAGSLEPSVDAADDHRPLELGEEAAGPPRGCLAAPASISMLKPRTSVSAFRSNAATLSCFGNQPVIRGVRSGNLALYDF
jgi:hypothetical protein